MFNAFIHYKLVHMQWALGLVAETDEHSAHAASGITYEWGKTILPHLYIKITNADHEKKKQ